MVSLLNRLTKSPPIDIYDPNLELYLPLYDHTMGVSPFISKDLSHHTATATGATWGIQGRTFDGIDDGISIPDAASLDIAGAITVGGWIKTNTAGQTVGTIVRKGIQFASQSNYGINIYEDTRCFFEFWTGTVRKTIEVDTALSVGTWYFLVGVYDGTFQRIYRQGVEDATPINLGSVVLDVDATALRIGRDDVYFGKTTVGAVWLYNQALSAAQIQRIYLATKFRY